MAIKRIDRAIMNGLEVRSREKLRVSRKLQMIHVNIL